MPDVPDPVPTSRRRRVAMVLALVASGLLVTSNPADAAGAGTCDEPSAVGCEVVGTAPVASGAAPATPTPAGSAATHDRRRADGSLRAAGRDGCRTDGVPRCRARVTDRGPWSIALMVADAGSLTAPERSLTAMLERRGHTVTPFTGTTRPLVNARNNPSIDLLLFSPSFTYSNLYHPGQRHSLPMLDMAKYSWYRRYVMPWGDQIAGPRFSNISATSRAVFYEDARVIPWGGPGVRVGRVRVARAARFSGGAPMRQAIDHSTRGSARYFLRHVSDRGAESALGVYVPAGSTITRPAPTRAEERRRRSRAPWVGLVLFADDYGDGNQYSQLTRSGERLFEAAMRRLMNP